MPDEKDSERSGQQQQRQDRGFEQPGGQQGLPQQDDQRQDRNQTQQPRPTWGEQTPELDRQRAEGGGGTSSDSDGQQQDSPRQPGQPDPAQGGTGERQQGGGGQVHQAGKPGQHAGRMRNGGQDSH